MTNNNAEIDERLRRRLNKAMLSIDISITALKSSLDNRDGWVSTNKMLIDT